jgi:polar amino acid transport system substrate-binding protein
MTIQRFRRTALIGLAAVALTGAALAGCGDDDGDSSSSDTTPTGTSTAAGITKDDALAALLPASIVSAGTIKVGTDATYPPNEYVENGEIIGMDIDMGNAIGEVLGVKFTYTNSPFDAILPGVTSGKYDLGISSFTANAERQKVVNFATYLNAGTLWATKTGNPAGITIDDACGKKVSVQKGTVQVADIQARSKACTDGGKSAIEISQYQNQTDATGAVVSGKADAMLADLPVTAYAISTTGTLEAVGEVYDSAPYGIAVPCASAGSEACATPLSSQPEENQNFVTAIQGAIQSLIDGGQYTAILTQWELESGAIETSEINPAE